MTTESTTASVMCTVCGEAATVETDIAKPNGMADAVAVGLHFAKRHPEIVSRLGPDGDLGAFLLFAEVAS